MSDGQQVVLVFGIMVVLSVWLGTAYWFIDQYFTEDRTQRNARLALAAIFFGWGLAPYLCGRLLVQLFVKANLYPRKARK